MSSFYDILLDTLYIISHNKNIQQMDRVLIDMIKRQNCKSESISKCVRNRIAHSSDRIWSYRDFAGMNMVAVSKTLSRLCKEGVLTRIRKGVYYKPKQTVIGNSLPSPTQLNIRLLPKNARPAGLTAANVLGFTTQNPTITTYAISKNSAPKGLTSTKIIVNRPNVKINISHKELAILEFLRDKGQTSELSSEETIRNLLNFISDITIFKRLSEAAMDEPPRVRAILGALGQEAGFEHKYLKKLYESISQFSKYDFGHLRSLKHAKEWNAK